MNVLPIKDEYKIFAVDHLTFAFNCKVEFDKVKLFDRLVEGNETSLGVEGLEVNESLGFDDFDDFCYYMRTLATSLQEMLGKPKGFTNKWKEYVVGKFVRSYNHPIDKAELYNRLSTGDKFLVELYQIKFFSLYDGLSVGQIINMMVYDVITLHQLDNCD